MVTTPNTILVEKAKSVEKFDKKLKEILKGMQETLDATVDPVGVGLAAPQVGISKRIFLSKPAEDGPTQIFINPEILSESEGSEIPVIPNSEKIEIMKNKSLKKPKKSKGKLLEGCLSIPNIWGNVSRKKEIKVAWQDETGEKHEEVFKGFPAIIIQHELDHLNGVLFTKHVMEQGETLYRSHKNADGEDEFDELEV